jgi:hypothetical protein
VTPQPRGGVGKGNLRTTWELAGHEHQRSGIVVAYDAGEVVLAVEDFEGFGSNELAGCKETWLGNAVGLGDTDSAVTDHCITINHVTELGWELEERTLCDAARQRFLLGSFLGAVVHVVLCSRLGVDDRSLDLW